MKVLALFDPNYTGPPANAVWIIDSVANCKWFEEHTRSIDPNSAVFRADSDPLTIIWNIFDHHPMWTEIEVLGRKLTTEDAIEIASDATVAETQQGFRLARRVC